MPDITNTTQSEGQPPEDPKAPVTVRGKTTYLGEGDAAPPDGEADGEPADLGSAFDGAASAPMATSRSYLRDMYDRAVTRDPAAPEDKTPSDLGRAALQKSRSAPKPGE